MFTYAHSSKLIVECIWLDMVCVLLPDLTIQYTIEPVNATTIHMQRKSVFPECFNFSIFVDEELVDDNVQTNYTVSNLSPNTTYHVCLVARDGHNHTQSNWMHCEDIDTGLYYFIVCGQYLYWISYALCQCLRTLGKLCSATIMVHTFKKSTACVNSTSLVLATVLPPGGPDPPTTPMQRTLTSVRTQLTSSGDRSARGQDSPLARWQY